VRAARAWRREPAAIKERARESTRSASTLGSSDFVTGSLCGWPEQNSCGSGVIASLVALALEDVFVPAGSASRPRPQRSPRARSAGTQSRPSQLSLMHWLSQQKRVPQQSQWLAQEPPSRRQHCDSPEPPQTLSGSKFSTTSQEVGSSSSWQHSALVAQSARGTRQVSQAWLSLGVQ
jgi:hypothetical protein